MPPSTVADEIAPGVPLNLFRHGVRLAAQLRGCARDLFGRTVVPAGWFLGSLGESSICFGNFAAKLGDLFPHHFLKFA
ncbi:MAG: hypothetical protein E5W82_32595 [Mesorhizobium sp.]|nr:MAG: hypothetical protein E5W82_32595 [Mesorhizobium sp.]TJW48745.1 MAG: hypothetical protein E5W83_01840 [Mesorhizobium sp.]